MATSKKQDSPLASLLTELRTLTDRISTAEAGEDPRAIKKLRLGLEQVTAQLKNVTHKLDPVLRPESIFDPTDPNTSGRVVALTLVAQIRHPLAKIPEFYGAGVYAIYYRGDFEPYAAQGHGPPDLHRQGRSGQPGRQGRGRPRHQTIGPPQRAREVHPQRRHHLDINDFDCRFLIVQTGFQKSAEDY